MCFASCPVKCNHLWRSTHSEKFYLLVKKLCDVSGFDFHWTVQFLKRILRGSCELSQRICCEVDDIWRYEGWSLSEQVLVILSTCVKIHCWIWILTVLMMLMSWLWLCQEPSVYAIFWYRHMRDFSTLFSVVPDTGDYNGSVRSNGSANFSCCNGSPMCAHCHC